MAVRLNRGLSGDLRKLVEHAARGSDQVAAQKVSERLREALGIEDNQQLRFKDLFSDAVKDSGSADALKKLETLIEKHGKADVFSRESLDVSGLLRSTGAASRGDGLASPAGGDVSRNYRDMVSSRSTGTGDASGSSTKFGLLRQTYVRLVEHFAPKPNPSVAEVLEAENRLDEMVTYERQTDTYSFDLASGLGINNRISVTMRTEIGVNADIKIVDRTDDGLRTLSRDEVSNIMDRHTAGLENFNYSIRSGEVAGRESISLVISNGDAKMLIGGLRNEQKNAIADVIFDIRQSLERLSSSLDAAP